MPIIETDLAPATLFPTVLLFADFVDLPIRGAMAPYPITVPAGLAGAGADAAGHVFDTVNEQALSIGAVEYDDGSSGTLTLTLRATPDEPALLAALDDQALYVGRRVRLWLGLTDGAGTMVAISARYTGFMSVPAQTVDAESGTLEIAMEVENWAALFGAAPARTWLMQKQIDAGDLSADVSIGGVGGSAPAYTGPIRVEPHNPYEQYR